MKKEKSTHEKYMRECLALANKGDGYVSPNPMVGCVIVKNGKVVGRGYHKKYGGPHAEVYALAQAGKKAMGSTLYVNLEPCSHFGKTPPCVDAIISRKVKRVVIAMRDPNPLVDGSGIKKLRAAKIDVVVDVLKTEAIRLNEKFVKFVGSKFPFITLKIAETLDGRIADVNGDSKWISNVQAQKYAHSLRATHDAILVGANTIAKDNPELTVRYVKGRNPIRVVVDGRLSSPLSAKIFKDTKSAKTIIFVAENSFHSRQEKIIQLEKLGVRIIKVPAKSNNISLETVLDRLHRLNVSSVLVEGGANITSQFIKNGLANKLVVIIAPKILGDGIQSVQLHKNLKINQALKLENLNISKYDDNVVIEGYLKN
jgi:diaminohydroxyphosphoribosylaminopyrimidine deaminase/5-amino-6-(5-phosphoribosylamino)uracil reductase